MRAAWALASAKALVSSYLSFPSFPHGALLDESGVVSVVELSLARVCFHISLYIMSGPSSELKLIMRLISQILTSHEVSDYQFSLI